MNYLNFKKQFPKSTNLFFDWVSKQNPNDQNNYVDNVYFYQFFALNIEYRQLMNGNVIIIDKEKRYFNKLKIDLMLFSGNINYKHIFNNNGIRFSKYSDTNEECIVININSESSFESAFFILERLIENKYYDKQ